MLCITEYTDVVSVLVTVTVNATKLTLNTCMQLLDCDRRPRQWLRGLREARDEREDTIEY